MIFMKFRVCLYYFLFRLEVFKQSLDSVFDSAIIKIYYNLRTSNMEFVTIQSQKLWLYNKPFIFLGANCYYLMSYGADEKGVRRIADDTLSAAQSMGLTVIRTWAFSDGPRWNSLQPEAGVFSEQVFRGLDWVIYTAGLKGLRLVLCFTDYWGSYGGMKQYMDWCHPGANVNEFYQNPDCQKLFKSFITAIIYRINTFNGIMYRDDPTIMSWEIANEARCKGNQDVKIVANWVGEISNFVKELDPNHLVTLGDEGFFGEDRRDFQQCNPYNTKDEGIDFLENGKHKAIDYLSLHIWPDQWLSSQNPSVQQLIVFTENYIMQHARAAQILGKPLVIEEFGYKGNKGKDRFQYFQSVMQHMWLKCVNTSDPLHGILFWMLASKEYGDFDGYNVYMQEPSHQRSLQTTYLEDQTPQLLLSRNKIVGE
eukprot:TRINITY_DN14336_c0_g1_i7.p1 TRINITY_DN14336_c0_g1~~TRINITY_DN14336_c0_g1_i7.p1  ORF type:complete len:424 (+),score=24.37 TRINITY_DN14336_c0_g1_i7:542-1813(+)